MVLIFGRLDDASTTWVAEWLHSFGKQYFILNTDDDRGRFELFDESKKELIFIKGDRKVNLLDVESVWVRRDGLSMKSFNHQGDINLNIFFDRTERAQKHVTEEKKVLVEYFHNIVSRTCRNVIGSFQYGDVNKLYVLDMAVQCGLMVPTTYVVTRKKQIADLLNAGKKLITKPLSQSVYSFTETVIYFSYVEEITHKELKNIPDSFFPSWIQEKIEKKYEIRVFYLMGKCYSMAIFSQEYESTSTDFRKATDDTPTRHVPYALPEVIADRVDALMKAIHLNTGSLDLIVDTEGNYIFLEVNPVGQFAMTSYPCNFYLEKLVAEYLCNQ